MKKIKVLDTTLRDGAQMEGISFSLSDKLKLINQLDRLGVDYIEAGNPASNPKDQEFFEKMKDYKFTHAKLAAFGSTRRRDILPQDDSNVISLLAANTPVVVIFGKSWDFHVTDIIKTSLEENLNMVESTVAFFKEKGKEVIFDAEHFFDGYVNNPKYAAEVLLAATRGGADCIALCDTNGGMFPQEIARITKEVINITPVEIGIHTHNDSGMAVANTIESVIAGACHVQGTLTGIGERCGNANLSTIIANLQLKADYSLVPEDSMIELTPICRTVAEIQNMSLGNMPFVGQRAFTHKAGMHIDGVLKNSRSFEHVEPNRIGNERRFLLSEVAGKSALVEKVRSIIPNIKKDSPELDVILKMLKEQEHKGYQFEGAEGSFEIMVYKAIGTYKQFFDLEQFKIIGEQLSRDGLVTSLAMIKILVEGIEEITAAEGNGPVNALDNALRKALYVFYPTISQMHLTDYKVRVLDAKTATGAKVRVLIESTDGTDYWTTVGVSTDIIEASWIALVDSVEYKLLKDMKEE